MGVKMVEQGKLVISAGKAIRQDLRTKGAWTSSMEIHKSARSH